MPVTAFDHVQIMTSNVEAMTKWYQDVLGLKKGWRPNFSVGGVWLYLGDAPYVHLVESSKPYDEGRIEHFAFRAAGLAAFREVLDAHGITPRESPVPGTEIVQFNIRDPDGNHIHVDFTGEA